MHEERNTKTKTKDNVPEGAIPSYLLDREEQNRAKVLSNMIKQKRKEKAVSTDETQLSPTRGLLVLLMTDCDDSRESGMFLYRKSKLKVKQKFSKL